MAQNKVIVFGPTGNVGSVTAITAQQNGAKVYLAMRDTSKPIPGLSAEQEKSRGFERVSADLTKADTVEAAVKQSGATRAFIYLAHQASDHMKSTIQALKSGGVETVVFLSSYTIRGELSSISQKEIIPWLHAQVELQLENIYGPKNYISIRPGAFATNSLGWWSKGIKAGEVKMFGPNVKFDWTTPDDMGGVAGTVLAKGAKDGQHIIYVYGPQFISSEEAFGIVQKEALIKDVKLSIVDQATAHEDMIRSGFPEPIVNYLLDVLDAHSKDPKENEFPCLKEGQENVKQYMGRPGMSFKEWIVKNKAQFAL